MLPKAYSVTVNSPEELDYVKGLDFIDSSYLIRDSYQLLYPTDIVIENNSVITFDYCPVEYEFDEWLSLINK